jgi:hypothetical protein
MNVFYTDVVNGLGEEERKGEFARRNSCTRLFESIRMPPVDDDQLVRKRVLARSCLILKPDSELSAFVLGVSNDFSAVGELVLLTILCAKDDILEKRRCSKVKRLSLSSLLFTLQNQFKSI